MFFSGKSGAVQIIERQLKANQYVFDMKKKKKNLPETAILQTDVQRAALFQLSQH